MHRKFATRAVEFGRVASPCLGESQFGCDAPEHARRPKFFALREMRCHRGVPTYLAKAGGMRTGSQVRAPRPRAARAARALLRSGSKTRPALPHRRVLVEKTACTAAVGKPCRAALTMGKRALSSLPSRRAGRRLCHAPMLQQSRAASATRFTADRRYAQILAGPPCTDPWILVRHTWNMGWATTRWKRLPAMRSKYMKSGAEVPNQEQFMAAVVELYLDGVSSRLRSKESASMSM